MPHRTRLARHARQNAVAYLALFVALGGTSAYAANTIGSEDIIDDSILSQDIRNGQVTRGDIAANAINSSRVADGALTGADIDERTLGRVPTAGAAALEDHVIERVTRESGLSPTYPDGAFARATCPAGTSVVGSGYDTVRHTPGDPRDQFYTRAHLNAMTYSTDGRSVGVNVRVDQGSDAYWNNGILQVTAQAICGRVVPPAG